MPKFVSFNNLSKMRELDFINNLSLEQMQKNLALSIKRMAEEHRMRRTPRFIAKEIINIDSGPPIFSNPLLNELYIQGSNIPEDTIANILSLPRENLIEDLVQIIYDSIFRYSYFSKTHDGNNSNWQVIHALFLLKELEAEEALEPILDFFSQDENLLDFWLGDILTQEMSMIIFTCGRNNLARLNSFMKEPNRYTYSRAEISEGVNQMALHNVISKEQAINWYKDLFEFYLTNNEDNDVIDTDLNGLMLGCILDLNGEELLPIIEQMFKLKLINREISGNWRDTQTEIKRPQHRIHVREIKNITEIYADIRSWVGQDKEETDENIDYNEYQNSLFNEPITRSNPKIGRNDPCNCGSGKKYKKCCGALV